MTIDTAPRRGSAPRTSAEAVQRLVAGNAKFARLAERGGRGEGSLVRLDPNAVGFVSGGGAAPVQRPFAAVLGCADARVPIEIVCRQRANDLFVVRVAGNGAGLAALGSFGYAAANFADSLRLAVVLGHSQCGAVTAAVDAFLSPRSYLPLASHYPLRSLVDAILVAVRAAEIALQDAHGTGVVKGPGHRDALVEVSVVLNAALTAFCLAQDLGSRRCRVVFGRYHLSSGRLRLPVEFGGTDALAAAPTDDAGLRRLAADLAGSAEVVALLRGRGPAKAVSRPAALSRSAGRARGRAPGDPRPGRRRGPRPARRRA